MLRTAAGTNHSSFLCLFRRAYTVLSFGDCSQGALGHSHGFLSDSYEAAPVEDLPGDVIKIASGHYHSFAISSNGDLWSWGRNNEGQLGRSSKESRLAWAALSRKWNITFLHFVHPLLFSCNFLTCLKFCLSMCILVFGEKIKFLTLFIFRCS